jgi:UDP-N-acetylmuramyl tripeptide synthase
LKLKTYYFGIESQNVALTKLSSHADTRYCGHCQSQLEYECVYISHLGKYKCPICKNKRPAPDFFATSIKLSGIVGSSFKFNFKNGKYQINTNIAGLYNVYNICAALAAISISNLSIDRALKSIVNFSGAFGRIEKIEFKDRIFYILLVKNPAGFNEVVRTVFSENSKKNLAVIINDNFADGRDVSWLWDVDFEKIKNKLNLLLVSGLRAEDIALRLKYANLGIKPKIILINKLFKKIIILTKPKDTIFILPTYSALLDINKQLSKLKIAKSYWQS